MHTELKQNKSNKQKAGEGAGAGLGWGWAGAAVELSACLVLVHREPGFHSSTQHVPQSQYPRGRGPTVTLGYIVRSQPRLHKTPSWKKKILRGRKMNK